MARTRLEKVHKRVEMRRYEGRLQMRLCSLLVDYLPVLVLVRVCGLWILTSVYQRQSRAASVTPKELQLTRVLSAGRDYAKPEIRTPHSL
jgi:hypothetical protein